MSQSWHYEWCPACGVTGQVLERTFTGDNTTMITSALCEACEGTGRVKVPDGFHLVLDEPPLRPLGGETGTS